MVELMLDERVHSPGQASGEAGLGLQEDESLRSAVGGGRYLGAGSDLPPGGSI